MMLLLLLCYCRSIVAAAAAVVVVTWEAYSGKGLIAKLAVMNTIGKPLFNTLLYTCGQSNSGI